MFFIWSCPIYWSQVLSREWRCSWSSADKRCSNYIWMINNFIACYGATYIEVWRYPLVFHKEGFQQTAVSHCRGMIANAYIFPCFPRTNHYTNGLTQLLLGHSIVHHKISSSIFQVMAWCRFGANPFKIIIISNFRLGCCPILIQWGWQHQATPNTGSRSSCPLPEPILTSSQYNPF